MKPVQRGGRQSMPIGALRISQAADALPEEIGPLLARRVLMTRQAGDDLTHTRHRRRAALHTGSGGRNRAADRCSLHSIYPAGVLNQLLQRYAVPGGAAPIRFINGNRSSGSGFTLLNGDTDQRRDHTDLPTERGSHRVVSGYYLRRDISGDFTIFPQHKHTADVLALQVITNSGCGS